MTTRRRSTLAVVLGIMAVMLAPVHVAAYDANANRPDPTARFILPDLEVDDVGPFGDNLISRRAMEHPREWHDWAWWGAGAACWYFGCNRYATGALIAANGLSMALETLATVNANTCGMCTPLVSLWLVGGWRDLGWTSSHGSGRN